MFVVAGCGRSVGAGDDASVNPGDGATAPVDAGPMVTGEPQWAMLGATPQRNGRSAFVGPSQATEQVIDLSVVDGDRVQVFVTAVGPDGAVYAVVRNRNELGRLVSLQPDGSINWLGPLDGVEPIDSVGGVGVGAVGGMALTSDGLLLLEGAQRVDPEDASSPVNTVFGVGSNGALVWSGRPYGESTSVAMSMIHREHRHSTPLMDSTGNVYVYLSVQDVPELTANGYHLCSFDATGAFRWCWDRVVGDTIYVAPAMSSEEILYIAVENEDSNEPAGPDSQDGVYTVDLDGAEQWFLPLPNVRVTTIALGDDATLYYTGWGTGVFVGSVEPAGGKGWTATFPLNYQAITTSVAITPGDGPEPTLYVGGWHGPDGEMSEGSITALTPDGVERWKVQTGGLPCGGMAVDATGAVYSLVYASMLDTTSARLVSLEPDGTTRLSTDIEDPIHPPIGCIATDVTHHNTSVVLAQGGRIYFGSDNGKLHILSP